MPVTSVSARVGRGRVGSKTLAGWRCSRTRSDRQGETAIPTDQEKGVLLERDVERGADDRVGRIRPDALADDPAVPGRGGGESHTDEERELEHIEPGEQRPSGEQEQAKHRERVPQVAGMEGQQLKVSRRTMLLWRVRDRMRWRLRRRGPGLATHISR